MSREYKEVYTVPEVASLLRAGVNTIYDACKRDQIPHIRFSKTVRVPGWWVKAQLEPTPNA